MPRSLFAESWVDPDLGADYQCRDASSHDYPEKVDESLG